MKLARIQANKWYPFPKSTLESSPSIMSTCRPNFLRLLPQKSPKKSSVLTMEANASLLSILVPIEHASHSCQTPYTRKFGIPALDIYLSLPGNRIYMQLSSPSKLWNWSHSSNLDDYQDPFTNEDESLKAPNVYIYIVKAMRIQ